MPHLTDKEIETVIDSIEDELENVYGHNERYPGWVKFVIEKLNALKTQPNFAHEQFQNLKQLQNELKNLNRYESFNNDPYRGEILPYLQKGVAHLHMLAEGGKKEQENLIHFKEQIEEQWIRIFSRAKSALGSKYPTRFNSLFISELTENWMMTAGNIAEKTNDPIELNAKLKTAFDAYESAILTLETNKTLRKLLFQIFDFRNQVVGAKTVAEMTRQSAFFNGLERKTIALTIHFLTEKFSPKMTLEKIQAFLQEKARELSLHDAGHKVKLFGKSNHNIAHPYAVIASDKDFTVAFKAEFGDKDFKELPEFEKVETRKRSVSIEPPVPSRKLQSKRRAPRVALRTKENYDAMEIVDVKLRRK